MFPRARVPTLDQPAAVPTRGCSCRLHGPTLATAPLTQVVDHILIKEGKTWGMGVVVDKTKGGGPPLMGKTMDR